MKFPTQQLILEGPDLAGKTTLSLDIHKLTKYRWNIQDRSALSMLIFAKFYNRDSFDLIENFKNELYNLNNRFIMLLPDWDTISNRYTQRGDELHDLISLKQTYNLFEAAIEEFGNYPNVMVARNENCLQLIVDNLLRIESFSLKQIQQQICQLADNSENKEALGVNFTIYDDCNFKHLDEQALEYEKEREYYTKIKDRVVEKIINELCGINSKNTRESKNSRRFIYTDDTCISLANFNYRKDCLDCHFVLRSSNVRDTLYYDLNFLYSLCKLVFNQLGLNDKVYCRMRFTINSAHIPNIIE
jgi:hypothetical protein